MRTSSVPVARHNNNLDAIRLLASVAVLVGHAWPLTGDSDHAPRVNGILLSHVAVNVFFSISGYLIATSWRSSPRPVGFLRRRIARIFPALIAAVLITVLVLGPIVTTVRPGAYFAAGETWAYLSGIVLAPSYALPGVFDANPTTAVNGSIWSLGPEFVCYLLVLGIGLALHRLPDASRRFTSIGAFVVVGVLLAVVHGATEVRALHDASGAMVFFAAGAVVALVFHGPPPVWPLVPLLGAWIAAGLFSRDASLAVSWIALPYIVLSVGLRSWPGVRAGARFGDVSYGVYLWAFPIQQVVRQYAPGLPLGLNIVLVLVMSLAIGGLSWHLIEKHALAWARRDRSAVAAASAFRG